MKITIDLDVTPEEMRRMLGLPDVQKFQNELLKKVQEQMEEGVEGYDPMTLLKPYMPGSASMDQFQQLMLKMMSTYTGTNNKSDKN